MVQSTTARSDEPRTIRRSTISPLLWQLAQGQPSFALEKLYTSPQGLDDEEVQKRRKIYGKNEVARDKPPAWWTQLLHAFSSPFILVLVVLAAVSYFTDVYLVQDPKAVDWKKVIILTVMILVSGILRFWQEFRSAKAAEKLKAMVRTMATVSRNRSSSNHQSATGQLFGRKDRLEVPITDIVPGDIVHLSAGDIVPADVRVIAAKDLFVSQSALTGESMPVEKHATFHREEGSASASQFLSQASLVGMNDLCFMGTSVVSGTATAVAVAIGSQTIFGSLAGRVLDHGAPTSFDKGVNQLTFVLIRFMVIMVPVVMVINGLSKGDWREAFLFGLAVAVGLTPEMLPLIVSANLAKGAIKLSKNKVIVKRLNSMQALGAMDILCTDKTGTLTEDRVVLVQHLDSAGKSSASVLRQAYLNSVFQTGLKNLLDRAIIERGQEKFLGDLSERYIKLDEIPFDFARRRMSVVLRGNDLSRILICKGAVEEVLEVCTRIGEEEAPLTEPERQRLKSLRNELNADGMRVLAVAYRAVSVTERDFSTRDEKDLTLAGFIAFLDPPKPSADAAIKALSNHGVRIKIITGDNAAVAAKVCFEVGLKPGDIILGHDIEDMNDDELEFIAEHTRVFAKINPIQKARIVRALKARGHTVGFLGDGINDAAALRDADVGISVDTAADLAKESADIILLEKNLMVLQQGVVQGRAVFGNIVKYIKTTASSNFGNVFSVLAASAFIPFLPMAALQLLVQNLLYDLSQLALPWDNVDREFIQKPRKWDARGVARFMVFIGPISSVFDITTFCFLWYVLGANSRAHQSLFQSGWFIEGLLSQILIVHILRTQKIPFFQSIASAPVLFVTAAAMVVGSIIPFTPFGASIGLQSLPASYFPWLCITLISYCLLTQIVKTWFIRRFRAWL